MPAKAAVVLLERGTMAPEQIDPSRLIDLQADLF